MIYKRKLLQRYILNSIIPYFILALTLLSLALFAQQASRIVELTGEVSLLVVSELFVLLLPNIFVFSVPAASLLGIIIGLKKMGSDSELIVTHGAGISDLTVMMIPLLLGILLTFILLFTNFYLTPFSAKQIRLIVAQAGLAKLNSPIEPKMFYDGMPGKVIFVRDGDKNAGRWQRVFIHWQTPDHKVRLVTARAGRIDTSDEQSELVLSDAEVITLSEKLQGSNNEEEKIITERSATLRMSDERLDLGRKSFVRDIKDRPLEPEEMGFPELLGKVRSPKNTLDKRRYKFVLHRRLALCSTPIIFSLLGGALGLKTKRGGRGVGMLLATLLLVSYYLLTIGGENLGKSGILSPILSAWLANILFLMLGLILLWLRTNSPTWANSIPLKGNKTLLKKINQSRTAMQLTWGITDRAILHSLLGTFISAFTLLMAIFMVFTLFDLLRFIDGRQPTSWLIMRYLFFMLPYATMVLAPMALLVSTLATYAIMSRRSEAIAWWACGQSAYRLAIPGILFATTICAGMFLLQEGLLPQSNRIQNKLRAQIRGDSKYISTPTGRQWSLSPDQRQIYTYIYDEQNRRLTNPVVYQFDDEGVHIANLVIGETGTWREPGTLVISEAKAFIRGDGGIKTTKIEHTLKVQEEVFKPMLNTPAEMSFKQLSAYLRRLRLTGDLLPSSLLVALELKRSAPFAPLVLASIGIPLAFAYGKRNAIIALCIAIVIGVSFWGSISGFYIMGIKGILPPLVSAWSPAVVFGAIGIYLFTRTKT